MSDYAAEVVERLCAAFEPARDPGAAAAMSAYMRNLFPFIGIASPARALLTREAVAGLARPSEGDLVEATARLWAMPEREYQYAALALLERHSRWLTFSFLPQARLLITTKSWWDTVDALAGRVVGGLVARDPTLAVQMDAWIRDEDLWVARTAILHQLRFKTRTDPGRLFAYCTIRSSERDFFIRKAIGWALREYSKSDAAAVRAFVEGHADELSPLSQREALLWLNGGRKAKSAR